MEGLEEELGQVNPVILVRDNRLVEPTEGFDGRFILTSTRALLYADDASSHSEQVENLARIVHPIKPDYVWSCRDNYDWEEAFFDVFGRFTGGHLSVTADEIRAFGSSQLGPYDSDLACLALERYVERHELTVRLTV